MQSQAGREPFLNFYSIPLLQWLQVLLGYCVTVWFGRTVDRKMAERQWVMMYEPVHCTGFPLFQFLQGVEVPEKYSPSQSMTPSVSTQVCLPHVLPYCRRRTQVGELISGGGVKSWSYFEDGMCIGVDRDISGYPLETDLTGPEHWETCVTLIC